MICAGCEQPGATVTQWLDIGNRVITVKLHPERECAVRAKMRREGARYVENPYAEQDRKMVAAMHEYCDWLHNVWAPRWHAEQEAPSQQHDSPLGVLRCRA